MTGLSAFPGDPESPESMPARFVADSAHFSALRQHFHVLIDLDDMQREAAVEALRSYHPHLADELERLLAALDERDLVRDFDLLPSRIGPFQVLCRLGRGGMGDVYLAERLEQGFEQRVAVKLIGQRGFSADLTQRFLRERQILARLSHPNIAHLIDGGLTDGVPWLAMEYVDGLPLARWAELRKPDLVERIHLIRRIAAAVAFAHGQLVVHRDLKPANVLITADGTPKLLDFGIAKLLDESDVEATRTGLQALTLRYAAPEQLMGDRISTATDVHGLGVLLHELVCESSPWPDAAQGRQSWSHAIIHAAPAALAAAPCTTLTLSERRRLGGDLQRIVDKALAKTASERYAGAAAFADDLDDWLANRPLRSGIGSRREQMRHLLRRHRWPLLLTVAVLLSLTAGLLLAMREADRAEDQAVIAEANLDAMLGVLGAAVPQDFQSSEVPASTFLQHAAQRLLAAHADNPELIRRALGEIGLGLINLGEGDKAEPILQAAMAASVRNGDRADRQLSLYKLLVFSQDHSVGIARAEQTAQRIVELAGDPSATTGVAVDALASAAGVLSSHGNFASAEELFGRADARLERGDPLSAAQAENFWRQRGWSAWRAFQLDQAVGHLGQAEAIIASSPAAFSALRRAELHLLLAEVHAARGDYPVALKHLAAATPAFEQAYAPGHPERAQLQLVEAAVALLQRDFRAATTAAGLAVTTLEAQTDVPQRALTRGRFLLMESEAALGHCDEGRRLEQLAKRTSANPAAPLPRDSGQSAASMAAFDGYCGNRPGSD